jgi:hypothetical protein
MRYSAKFIAVLWLSLVCMFSGGCVFVVVGAAGAIGGYAISRDSFEGVTSKTPEELLSAAHKVLGIMGNITNEEPKSGRIDATVYGNHVTVYVIEINMNTTRLRVRARRALLPSAGVAQDIYTKIVNQLEKD